MKGASPKAHLWLEASCPGLHALHAVAWPLDLHTKGSGMATYHVRYAIGQGPQGSDDVLEVEAATFKTNGDFTDFYSSSEKNIGGGYNATGDVVLRVRNDMVADIRRLSD